jgi:hypothetical protein
MGELDAFYKNKVHLSPAELARASQIGNELLLSEGKSGKLGTLSASDYTLLRTVIPNNGLIDWIGKNKAKWEGVKKDINHRLAVDLDAYGYKSKKGLNKLIYGENLADRAFTNTGDPEADIEARNAYKAQLEAGE